MEYEIKRERSILHLFSMLMRVCCVMDVGPGHLTSVPGSAEQQLNIRLKCHNLKNLVQWFLNNKHIPFYYNLLLGATHKIPDNFWLR